MYAILPEYRISSRFPPHHIRLWVCFSDALDAERVFVGLEVVQVFGVTFQFDDGRELNVKWGSLLAGLARVGVVNGQALKQFAIVLLICKY
jgi:hypothetical protein